MTRVIKPESGEEPQALRPDMRSIIELLSYDLVSLPTPFGASNSEGMRCEKNRQVLRCVVEHMSLPTPFGGRSGASSGPRWADYRSGKTLVEAAAGRPSGRRHPSQPGVWGHQPPSLYMSLNYSRGMPTRRGRNRRWSPQERQTLRKNFTQLCIVSHVAAQRGGAPA